MFSNLHCLLCLTELQGCLHRQLQYCRLTETCYCTHLPFRNSQLCGKSDKGMTLRTTNRSELNYLLGRSWCARRQDRPNGWNLTTRAGRDWTPSHENKVTIEPYLYGNLLAAPGSTSLRHFLVVDSEVSVQSKRQAHTLCLGRHRKHRRAVSFNLKTPNFGVSNTYHSEHHRDEDSHMIRLTISFSQ